MKSKKQKVILSSFLAAVFACIAIVSGVLLGLNLNKSSRNASSVATEDPDAITTPAKLKLTTEASSLIKGGKFTIRFTFSVPNDVIWFAMQTTVVPMTKDGTAVDYEACQYLSYVSAKKPQRFGVNQDDDTLPFESYEASALNRLSNYNNTDVDKKKETGIFFMLSRGTTGSMSSNVDCMFEVTLMLAEEAPFDELTFGISPDYPKNFLSTIPTEDQADDVATYTPGENTYASNLLTFTTRDANSEAKLKTLTVSVDTKDETGAPKAEEYVIGGEGSGYSFDENKNCNITLPDTDDLDLSLFYEMEENSEGAAVKAGASPNADTAPATFTELDKDKATNVTVSGTNRVIYIQTTSEDGKATEVYTVTLTFTYVRLSGLSATSSGYPDDAENPITNYDLDLSETDGEFDNDTYEYTAFVPEGTTATAVVPTLATDYGASQTIKVVKGGAYKIMGDEDNVADQGKLYLQNISDGEYMELEVTAQDAATKKTYKITFEVVSADTSLKEEEDPETGEKIVTGVKVTGATTGKEIPNNTKKAEDEGKDFYYFVGEDGVKITVTPNEEDERTKIEIKVMGSDPEEFSAYDPEKEYPVTKGTPVEVIVKVTAPAGNYKEYSLVLEKFDGFKLVEDSPFDLIALVEIDGMNYRRTYRELGWTHGVDDIDRERYVLGEIVEGTTLDTLIDNFDFEGGQLEKVHIYDKAGNELFDGLSSEEHGEDAVCTSWVIKYGDGDDDSTKDIIYISVLCDVNGDGMVNTNDSSTINSYIAGQGVTFEDLEVMLASYIMNTMGVITTNDSASVNAIIAGNSGVTIETYLRPKAGETP